MIGELQSRFPPRDSTRVTEPMLSVLSDTTESEIHSIVSRLAIEFEMSKDDLAKEFLRDLNSVISTQTAFLSVPDYKYTAG